MKNAPLYEKTVGILVDAYLNDTLQHNNCCACAVGNMVASNCGIGFGGKKYKGKVTWDEKTPEWWFVFMTYGTTQTIDFTKYAGQAKKEILSTGYTVKQLAKIEYAFETAPRGTSEDEWMFNGLMAVIEVLDRIHENTDSEITTTSKNRFTKPVAA